MDSSVLLTVASSADHHPLIDIDLTALIQFAIFLVTMVVATQFLFRPYLRMRDERDEGTRGARQEADALAAEVDAKLRDYETKLAQARVRAQDERRTIRAEAAQHQREATDTARSEATEAMEAARQKLQTASAAARAELLPKADLLARDMVSRLLARKDA